MLSFLPKPKGNIFQRTITLCATAALAAVAFMFSAVLMVVIASIVILGGVYIWWKTRKIRKQMSEFSKQSQHHQHNTQEEKCGDIIEGEVVSREIITKLEYKQPANH